MSNGYFTLANPEARRTLARAESINSTLQAVEDGFDKLPTEAELKQDRVAYVADTGVANAYVVAIPYAPASYTEGLKVAFKVAAANTGASTINVSGLGVKPLRRFDGSALIANDLVAGMIAEARYDGVSFLLVGVHGALQANSDAAAASAAAAALSAAAAANATANTNSIWCGTASGTNTLTLTPSPAIASYAAGLTVRFVAAAANTGAVTVNVSGLGAKTIKDAAGNALTADAIASGAILEATYDGTDFRLGRGGALTGFAQTIAGSLSSLALRIGEATSGFYRISSGIWAAISNGIEVFRTTAAGCLAMNKAARAKVSTVSYATTVTLDGDTGNNFIIGQITGGSLTIANPSNFAVGQGGYIQVTNHASAPVTPSMGNQFKLLGVAGWNTTAGGVSIIGYEVLESGVITYSVGSRT